MFKNKIKSCSALQWKLVGYVIQGPFSAPQLDQTNRERLIVSEKENVFKVTKFVGSEDIRKEAKELRQKLYVQHGNNFKIIMSRGFLQTFL